MLAEFIYFLAIAELSFSETSSRKCWPLRDFKLGNVSSAHCISSSFDANSRFGLPLKLSS